MKHYYTFLKLFCSVADVFLILVIAVLIGINMLYGEYSQLYIIIPLSVLFVAVFALIEIFLIRYYGNIVISIDYSGSNVVLVTNNKTHYISGDCFTEVCEDTGTARTYIKYRDGKKIKTLVFQMKYSPFKTHRLDIDKMKAHMPNAVFR